MGTATERLNRTMLRVRDRIDQEYATELDLAALAAAVHYSPDHLIRSFRQVFGETPHRYLQRRRIERAMFLLRTTDLPVTDVCLRVGFSSVGAFGELFATVLGESPTAYRQRGPLPVAPAHFLRAWNRPSSHVDFEEASTDQNP
ncbi:MAG: helix-turn-helix transcriptional regulator [Propionibacteriaceae bacterium]